MNADVSCLIEQDNSYRPTEAEFLASLVSKTSRTTETTAAWAMNIRVPISDFLAIKALSEYAEKSMNQIAVHLFRAGLESLAGELSDDDASAVREIKRRLMGEWFASIVKKPSDAPSDGLEETYRVDNEEQAS